MEQIIKKAIEGGWKPFFKDSTNERALEFLLNDYEGPSDADIFCDPLFWQALGVGLGNKEEMRCTDPSGTKPNPNCSVKQCEYAGYKNPKRMYDIFMETNYNEGMNKAIEYLKEITK